MFHSNMYLLMHINCHCFLQPFNILIPFFPVFKVFDIQELPASELKCDLNQNPVLEYTEQKIVKRIYALGRILSQVFDQFNLHYWTCGGTTLGLLRHKG